MAEEKPVLFAFVESRFSNFGFFICLGISFFFSASGRAFEDIVAVSVFFAINIVITCVVSLIGFSEEVIKRDRGPRNLPSLVDALTEIQSNPPAYRGIMLYTYVFSAWLFTFPIGGLYGWILGIAYQQLKIKGVI